MDLGLAPRPLGFGAMSISGLAPCPFGVGAASNWGWRHVGLGSAPPQPLIGMRVASMVIALAIALPVDRVRQGMRLGRGP